MRNFSEISRNHIGSDTRFGPADLIGYIATFGPTVELGSNSVCGVPRNKIIWPSEEWISWPFIKLSTGDTYLFGFDAGSTGRATRNTGYAGTLNGTCEHRRKQRMVRIAKWKQIEKRDNHETYPVNSQTAYTQKLVKYLASAFTVWVGHWKWWPADAQPVSHVLNLSGSKSMISVKHGTASWQHDQVIPCRISKVYYGTQ
jgi:hypothetical protein